MKIRDKLDTQTASFSYTWLICGLWTEYLVGTLQTIAFEDVSVVDGILFRIED
jgi:hypothetical protein